VHNGCRLLEADPPFWFNDCDTHPGSSGGPVFVKDAGTYELAAIQVAAGGGRANVALPLSEWADLTEKASCP
jgi:V8-like Glu-specific endopeptidase